jgi:transposase-like protein
LNKRRKFDDNFKARVALEAIKGEKTLSEISSEFEVHPNMIRQWKAKMLENAATVFTKKKDPKINELKELNDELFKKVGKQNIELEFLKKKYGQMKDL